MWDFPSFSPNSHRFPPFPTPTFLPRTLGGEFCKRQHYYGLECMPKAQGATSNYCMTLYENECRVFEKTVLQKSQNITNTVQRSAGILLLSKLWQTWFSWDAVKLSFWQRKALVRPSLSTELWDFRTCCSKCQDSTKEATSKDCWIETGYSGWKWMKVDMDPFDPKH